MYLVLWNLPVIKYYVGFVGMRCLREGKLSAVLKNFAVEWDLYADMEASCSSSVPKAPAFVVANASISLSLQSLASTTSPSSSPTHDHSNLSLHNYHHVSLLHQLF